MVFALVLAGGALAHAAAADDRCVTGRAANPAWHESAPARFQELERDYRAIQVKWHTFATRAVLADSRDLFKRSQALAEEASVKLRYGKEE